MALDPKTGQRMGRATIITELKALSKVRTKAVDPEDHIRRLKFETDRSAIILAATQIDDALLTALERVVKCDNREMRDAIFHGDGPLASFSRRITFAQALGIIRPDHAKQLHVIREVRNVAAHAQVNVSFDTQQIKNALASMLVDPEKVDDVETGDSEVTRRFFLLMCGLYADQIIGQDNPDDIVNAFARALRIAQEETGEQIPSPNKSPLP